MGRKDKKKKDETTSKKQKTSHDRNKNHQAHDRDPVDILTNVVKCSGYAEAQIVAGELDAHHKSDVGTGALRMLETAHREIGPGGKITWVCDGPAKWMLRAMKIAALKQAR